MTQLSPFSEQPHWLDSNDLVGTLGAGPHRRGGVASRMVENVSRRARSVDVFQAGRSFSPLNRRTSQYQRTATALYFRSGSLATVLREIHGRAEALPEKPT